MTKKEEYMLKKLALVSLVLALSMPAFADSVIWGGSTASWYDTPMITTTNLPPSSGDTAYSPEGNGGPAQQQLAQTFTAASDFTLLAMAYAAGGAAQNGVKFSLYDIGLPLPKATGQTIDLTTKTLLWENTFDFPGSAAESIAYINLSTGVDVYTGESYALVITETTTAQNAFLWYRNGGTTGAYTGGQVWRGSSTLNVINDIGNVREAGLAVYDHNVPEPATMALLGLGGLALLRRRK